MSLEINSTEQVIKIAAITLKGRLDAFEAPALRKMCDIYIADKYTHYVFDLTDVSMLDSAGLAVLVSVLKRTRIQSHLHCFPFFELIDQDIGIVDGSYTYRDRHGKDDPFQSNVVLIKLHRWQSVFARHNL